MRNKLPVPVKSTKVNNAWKDKLHPQDYEELRNTFQVFDEDNSGTIDPA
jgi:Ca2+-binding EF-hand superfamily protein